MNAATGAARGIVYVASQDDRYVEEAFLSADSVKRRFPDLSVTLFTDRPDHPLCGVGRFDEVRRIAGVSGIASDWAAGQLNRLRSLPLTPYERTLHLDTDTRIFTHELPGLFDLLDECDLAMVETAPDDSYSRRRFGKRMFNAGLALFRRGDAVWSWLRAWAESSERNFRLAGLDPLPTLPALAHVADPDVRRKLLCMDQISLVEILGPESNKFGLRLRTLDYSWNYRGSRLPENNRDRPRILHLPAFKARTRADILSVAHGRLHEGNAEGAERLYDYVARQEESRAAPRRRHWLPLPSSRAKSMFEAWSTPDLRRIDLHLRHRQPEMAFGLGEELVARSGRQPFVLAGEARAALQLGKPAEATALAEEAAAAAPKSAYVQRVLGEALLAAGRPVDAVVALRRAVADGAAESAFLLGQAWFELHDYRAAAAAFRRAQARDPRHVGARNNLMPALLGQGKARQALAQAERILADGRWDARALAFECIALAELGRHAEESALADLDRLVVTQELPVPAGYAWIDKFNAKLARALSRVSSLEPSPSRHATRAGWHSGNLADSGEPEIAALNSAILRAVEERIDSVAPNLHPFDAHAPQTYRMNAWTVIMEREGHQIPHIHAEGWLSGVYYVEVPPSVRADDPTRQGWLRLGPGEERWRRNGAPTAERMILPRPGLLVTFPSFVWHMTVPLAADGRRISYSFDIVPY